MDNKLDSLRSTAKRLERYARRVREKIWTGDRDDILSVLADLAETGEIARRLYSLLQHHISTSPPQPQHALKNVQPNH